MPGIKNYRKVHLWFLSVKKAAPAKEQLIVR
jgi:hypothetical protein